jgi:signal transduction histidine kinase/CheY-like chemotaxis protein
MPNDRQNLTSRARPNRLNDRLRDANRQLTLHALRVQEQAEELARRYQCEHDTNETLLKKQRQLRSLASELMLAEQRERKRLATELHDYLGQMMVLGRLKIGQARFRMAAADVFASRVIEDIDNIFTKSLSYIRTLMAELSPPVLYELGLPSALKWLAEQMPKQHQLDIDLTLEREDLPLPEDQALLLYHSVRELLLNVATHAQTSRASVLLTVEPATNRLLLVVKDRGRGFAPGTLEARPEAEHFGLFSIQLRMEAMGGCLHVDSAPGAGTTVTLELALSAAAHPEPAQATATPLDWKHRTSPEKHTGHRLLLVDDHAMVRQGLRAILEDYQDLSVVGEAANGVEGVSMAAEINPDVILMDINMPQMDGIEATKRIKAAQSGAIVIGLSVNNSAPVMQAMKQAGAAAFLSKDAAGEQLYDTITSLVAERRTRFIPPKAA